MLHQGGPLTSIRFQEQCVNPHLKTLHVVCILGDKVDGLYVVDFSTSPLLQGHEMIGKSKSRL